MFAGDFDRLAGLSGEQFIKVLDFRAVRIAGEVWGNPAITARVTIRQKREGCAGVTG
jgi:hypothetical protein